MDKNMQTNSYETCVTLQHFRNSCFTEPILPLMVIFTESVSSGLPVLQCERWPKSNTRQYVPPSHQRVTHLSRCSQQQLETLPVLHLRMHESLDLQGNHAGHSVERCLSHRKQGPWHIWPLTCAVISKRSGFTADHKRYTAVLQWDNQHFAHSIRVWFYLLQPAAKTQNYSNLTDHFLQREGWFDLSATHWRGIVKKYLLALTAALLSHLLGYQAISSPGVSLVEECLLLFFILAKTMLMHTHSL